MSRRSEQQKLYREANKDKIKIQRKQYREANKEKIKLRRKENYWKYAKKARERSREQYYANLEKSKAERKLWRDSNNDKMNGYKRTYYSRNKNVLREKRLCKKYNLSSIEYHKIMKGAGENCPICETKFDWENRHKANRPCFDHCHVTGKVRGVICGKCNSAIGQLNDDPQRLKRAIHWLSGLSLVPAAP